MPTAEELIGAGVLADLAAHLGRATGHPQRALAATPIGPLGFGDRLRAVAAAIPAGLPTPYPEFAAVIRRALVEETFGGWMIAPVAEAVAVAAVSAGDPGAFEDGLDLMTALTARLTAEFALRTFLNADLDRTLAVVAGWAGHPDEHVRRLAGEGTRPYLPWGRSVPALQARPTATVAILDALYNDDSEYVRRSAANHLNDLSRFHPALVVETAGRWLTDGSALTHRTVRRALRTLVKKGNPEALALLGFRSSVDLVATGPTLTVDRLAVGEVLEFAVQVHNTGAQPLAATIDYVVHHRKANGTTTPKVFKLAVATLAPGQRWTAVKRHSFRVITTRVYHPGGHAIGLQINGAALETVPFELVVPNLPR